jgi:hypothetical protein
MRFYDISLCLLAVTSFRVCDSKESTPSEGVAAEARATASASGAVAAEGSAALVAPKPRIGGSVVLVGDHAVELVLNRSGALEALVSNAEGKPVSAGAKLSVTAATSANARERVEFAFAAPRARFEGQAKGTLAGGPLDVSLDLGGRVASATLRESAVLRGPELGGSLLAAGDLGAEVFVRADGEVLALVRDRTGARLGADADLTVSAKVATAAGASHDLSLAFDGARGCFAGKVGAGIALAPGPFELSVSGKAGARVGALANLALTATAAHGGEIVVVGDYAVELVVEGKELVAYVFDAWGKAYAAADLGLELELGASGEQRLKLAFHAPSLSYRAAFSGSIDAAPIRVRLVASGKAFVGAALSLKALGKARLGGSLAAAADLGASADAELNAGVNVKAPAVNAKLTATGAKNANASAGANVSLTAPKVSVTAPKVSVTAPKVSVTNKASTGTKAGGSAKASAGFSLGTK